MRLPIMPLPHIPRPIEPRPILSRPALSLKMSATSATRQRRIPTWAPIYRL
jgi:hypothetical protein